MRKLDVLVVGSGASGSVASLMLSKAGYNVLTVDRASNIGGCANSRVDITESELPDGSKLDPILRELKAKPLKRFNKSLWKSKDENFTLKSDVYDFYFMRGNAKGSLEFQLMKKAMGKGCEFLSNAKIVNFKFKDGKIAEVSLKHGSKLLTISPKVIIGADGSFSICRKLAKIRERSYCLENFGAMISGKVFDGTQVLFDREFAPGGYVYSGYTGNESFVGVVSDRSIAGKSSKYFFDANKNRNSFMRLVKGNHIKNI
jgi:flavin-dependent dehydrogenase